MSSNQHELAEPPSDAISALKFAPNSSSRLLVSSWDRHVYLYDEHEGQPNQLVRKFEHRAPVLDVCFGKDDDEAYSVGLDWDVRRIDLTTGEQSILSTHEAGVKSVVYSSEHDLLISASWDKTLHIHFPSDMISHVPNTVPLPAKPFSLSLTPTKLVVAMANRLLEPWQHRESSLKFMTRAVACMPNDAGYASSSIEGRVAVEWFDPSESSQARKYAFKCHRQASDNGMDIVYPVNALAFHPVLGTFATGGGDGVVALWDANAKRRIRQYQRYPASVAALAFSGDGKFLAVGVSPGFEDGEEVLGEGEVKVFIRELGENEAKGKGAK
ncbi:mitotic spindle checkpoint protein Bub3 [Coniosporium tulheliwenetii]|uniref:Mitotic spindle checkpoint protein Bub3 n=1 Tax=Coniosporium tulheliwenetii TaxID=3383036 RepID=A0ACC2ZAQ4_9PEZI|nr:mitotic spindle checkpoint protein Bub3 [Cladosporium sp. JES 115]